jgi:hypothetical protein
MPFDHTLTYDDLKDAQRLYVHRSTTAWVSYVFWMRVLPVFVVPCIAYLLYYFAGRHFEYPAWYAPIAAIVAWLGLFMPALRFIAIRRAYRNLLPKGQKVLDVTVEFDEQQLISRIPGRSEGRILWPTFLELLEDDKIALLFFHKKRFLFIPKRAMPEDQWQLIRNRISRNRKVA